MYTFVTPLELDISTRHIKHEKQNTICSFSVQLLCLLCNIFHIELHLLNYLNIFIAISLINSVDILKMFASLVKRNTTF